MNNLSVRDNNTLVAKWLLLGAMMIIIQIVLGGITRLTESGLSITEWKPITGMIPPLNDAQWQAEFDKYKFTDQFKYVHSSFSLSDFKFIFFWEWFHRVWARMMGLVFIAGFIYFLAKRMFSRQMIAPMVILFLLGAVQGAIGWLMVKSGLVPEKYFVGHVELTTHLTAAIILLAYVMWFAFELLPSMQQKVFHAGLKNLTFLLIVLLLVQLVYGGFMAGLRGAASAPTWPSINGEFAPALMTEQKPFASNLINNPLMVHFVHRGIAYILFVLGIIYFLKAKAIKGYPVFAKFNLFYFISLLIQVVLGICTVLYSTNKTALVWLGALHQLNAMMMVISLTGLYFLLQRKSR